MKKTKKDADIDWLGPRSIDEQGDRGPTEFTHYAAGTKIVQGQLVWDWKPITQDYIKECKKRRAEVAKIT